MALAFIVLGAFVFFMDVILVSAVLFVLRRIKKREERKQILAELERRKEEKEREKQKDIDESEDDPDDESSSLPGSDRKPSSVRSGNRKRCG